MLKKQFRNGFTVINNEILRKKDMSSKAKGIYAVLISLPDEWSFSINGLKQILKESKSSISSGLKELEEFGLLKREYYNNSKGYKTAKYLISDTLYDFHPMSDFPIKEKPTEEKPTEENQTNNKIKKKSSKELINKKINKNIYFENSEINDLFINFLNLRTEKGMSNTDLEIKILKNKIVHLPKQEAIEVVQNSIINNWKGLYINDNKNIYTEPKYDTNEIKEPIQSDLEDIEVMLKEIVE